MPELINYIIKVNIIIGVLSLFYLVLLRNSNNFRFNRYYLLSILLIAFLLPYLSLPVKDIPLNKFSEIHYPDDLVEFTNVSQSIFYPVSDKTNNDYFLYFFFAYLSVSGILFFRFVRDIIRIYQKIHKANTFKSGKFIFIECTDIKSPFAFFNYLFVNRLSGTHPLIIDHEKVHAEQMHSLDLLIIELLIVLFWINPFIYLIKKELIAQHEYYADFTVLENLERKDQYLQQIYLQANNYLNFPLINKFNNSLTLKRLKMMKKAKMFPQKRFKHIVIITLTLIFSGFYACTNDSISVKEISQVVPEVKSKTIDIPAIYPLDKNKFSRTRSFGYQTHPILKVKKLHLGMDFFAKRGTQCYATADGVVTSVKYRGGYGKCIEIQHKNNYSTLYAHLKDYNVQEGDKVKAGDVIGYVGETGMVTTSALHYEVRINNKPVNPKPFLK